MHYFNGLHARLWAASIRASLTGYQLTKARNKQSRALNTNSTIYTIQYITNRR